MSRQRQRRASETEAVVVYTTVGRVEQASELAAVLVGQRLAACANWYPIQSLYRWQGRVEQGGEVALLLKTSQSRLPTLVRALRRAHPYAVPAILVNAIQFANPDYATWLHAELKDD